MSHDHSVHVDAPRPAVLRRLAPVVGLMLLSPICAEYLIGYDDTIGDPMALLGGLLIFGPLYGAVAVLIREIARRTGRGWPTMLLLGFAFGLVQAGLIDQSLFNPSYRDIPYWDDMLLPMIPGADVSASMVLNFVVGHMIWSFAAPIAVVEACVPRIARRPWLVRIGLSVMVVLYLASAALVFSDHVTTERFIAAPAQMIGAAVVVVALAVAAFAIPRRPAPKPGRVPPPWLIGCGAVAGLGAHHLVPTTWAGVALDMTALSLLGALVLFWSGRTPWGRQHVLALGGAALVVNAALSFVVEPLGNPSPVAKYAVNTVLTLAVIALLAWAYYRQHRTRTNTGSTDGVATDGETQRERAS